MTKNPQAKRALIAFIAFGLFLLSSTIAQAFPSSHDMAFVKAFSKDKKHSAACVVVWLKADFSNRNAYCRYELGKNAKFKRDDDNGIDLPKVLLRTSNTQADFKNNVKKWWFNKYQIDKSLNFSEVTQIVTFMSNAKITDFKLGDNKTYRTYPLNDISDKSVSQHVGNEHDQFAYLVHSSIQKMNLTKDPAEQLKTQNQQLETQIQQLKTQNQQLETQIQQLQAGNPPPEKSSTLDKIRLGIYNNNVVVIILCFLLLFGLFWFLPNKYNDLDKKLGKLKKDFSTNFSTLSGNISAIKKKQEQVVDKLSNARREEQPLLSRSNDLNSEKTIVASLKQQLNDIKYKHSDLVKKSNKAQTKHQETQKSLQEAQTELKTAQTELKTAKDKIQQLTNSLTEKKNQLKQEQSQRQSVEKALKQSEQSTQELLSQRFYLRKPDEIPFADWITTVKEQQGVWRWLQPALLGEFLVCEPLVDSVKEKGNEKDKKILKLLHLEDLMQHQCWVPLVEKSYKSDEELWNALQNVDAHFWLHRLLRAGDLLQSYFPEDLKPLSQHLFTINSMLRAAFVELGINFISPKILKAVPKYITNKANINYDSYEPLLVELLNTSAQAKKLQGQLVVDIESYGFGENAEKEVRVFAYNPSSWKE